MSCCFPFRVCCPPAEFQAALAEWIFREAMPLWTGGADPDRKNAVELAALLTKQWDLCPPGTAQAVIDGWDSPPIVRAQVIGEAIVDLYAASFAERDKAGGG